MRVSHTKIMDDERAICAQLSKASVRDTELAKGLAQQQLRDVHVARTRAGLIPRLARDRAAAAGSFDSFGTVCRSGGTYQIFVDEAGYGGINTALEAWALRFIVLHEYAHILHHDLPEHMIADAQGNIDTDDLWAKERDRYANGYAFERLRCEAQCAGDSEISGRIPGLMNQNDQAGPSTSEYQDRFQHLKDEPKNW